MFFGMRITKPVLEPRAHGCKRIRIEGRGGLIVEIDGWVGDAGIQARDGTLRLDA
jgi:hypothetical protein